MTFDITGEADVGVPADDWGLDVDITELWRWKSSGRIAAAKFCDKVCDMFGFDPATVILILCNNPKGSVLAIPVAVVSCRGRDDETAGDDGLGEWTPIKEKEYVSTFMI